MAVSDTGWKNPQHIVEMKILGLWNMLLWEKLETCCLAI